MKFFFLCVGLDGQSVIFTFAAVMIFEVLCFNLIWPMLHIGLL